jgi:hypothetical protein
MKELRTSELLDPTVKCSKFAVRGFDEVIYTGWCQFMETIPDLDSDLRWKTWALVE